MNAGLATLTVAALSWAAPAAAQFGLPGAGQHAHASLYHRVDGDVVRAAIEIEIDDGWHLYHDQKGNPDGIGLETVVTLSGAGIEWSETRFPEPLQIDQSFLGEGVWIFGHEGTVVLRAAGRLESGATGVDVAARIEGQTCEEAGTCLQYAEDLTSRGKGPDALFADFPADLLPAGAGGELVSGEIGGFGKPHSGEASATLYARADADGVVRAAIDVEIADGWHLYHSELGHPDAVGEPTTVDLGGRGILWTRDVRFPEPHELDQSMLGEGLWIFGHEGWITLYAIGRLQDGASVEDAIALLRGLTCDENGCIPYYDALEWAGEGDDALFDDFPADLAPPADAVDAAGAEGPAGGVLEGDSGTDQPADTGEPAGAGAAATRDEKPEDGGLLGFLLAAIGWGVFALLMPCTYPMIPITISFFTKQAEQRHGHVTPLALLYGAGIVTMFVLIGLLVGPPIIAFATHPWTNVIIGSLFVLFALALFGVIDLQPPRFLMNMAGQASARNTGPAAVFLMGFVFVVTSFTCTAPFVGTLLAVGAKSGDLGRVALGMAVFGATMAAPFVLLSILPGKVRAMPRAGEWMHVVKVTLGFVEVAAALKFFSNADLVWQWGILSRELFLMLWAGIAVVAAVFLLGLIRLEGESHESIGPRRLATALGVLLFGLYCAYGVNNELDRIMTAIVPNYSGRLGGAVARGTGEEASGPIIVKDDYDAALAIAREQDLGLLVNFTGFT